MKIVINLEELSCYEDESVAEAINDAIKREIDLFIKKMVKDSLAESEKQMRKVIGDATKKDWKKVYDVLSKLQGGC